ncbi:MAG: LemA family protein [Planctomycetes bacterium]|jgi:LemA protein|nr:LemA family protein [Planctomycetota bacterium]
MPGGILIGLLAVAGFFAVVALMAISIYNNLVSRRNEYKNSFAKVDVQLKRRYDLIPNLVESVKGAMAHERQTLDAVIQARNTAFAVSQKAADNPGDPDAMKKVSEAEAVLRGSMGRMFALAEAYPDLKANQNMLQLQGELGETENRIAMARQDFNDKVTLYNTSRETFPAIAFAGMMGFTTASLFEIDNPEERQNVRVKF